MDQYTILMTQVFNELLSDDLIYNDQQQKQQLTDYISKARLKFDALRVVVVNHD